MNKNQRTTFILIVIVVGGALLGWSMSDRDRENIYRSQEAWVRK